MSEDVIKIFFSYSRKDLDMRNKLEDHLSILREAGKISTWHDLQLETGTEWEPVILNKLDTADIILLLVSSNFIASKYCYGTELKRAIARHNEGMARVIPIILRPCDWNVPEVPFSKLNVLPTHAKPITNWIDQDEAFTLVAQRIRETVDQLRAKKLAIRPALRGNYAQLEALLKAGKWKEADMETTKQMYQIMKQQKPEGSLSTEDIEQFPCTDLHAINQLWVKHSNGKFGFSIQTFIWRQCGSPKVYNQQWEKFAEEVGWKNIGFMGINSGWKDYSQLIFSTAAPKGHLPHTFYLPLHTSLAVLKVSDLGRRCISCSI